MESKIKGLYLDDKTQFWLIDRRRARNEPHPMDIQSEIRRVLREAHCVDAPDDFYDCRDPDRQSEKSYCRRRDCIHHGSM